MLSALALLLLPSLAAEEPVFTVYLGRPLLLLPWRPLSLSDCMCVATIGLLQKAEVKRHLVRDSLRGRQLANQKKQQYKSVVVRVSTAFSSEMRTFGQRGRQGPASRFGQNVRQ